MRKAQQVKKINRNSKDVEMRRKHNVAAFGNSIPKSIISATATCAADVVRNQWRGPQKQLDKFYAQYGVTQGEAESNADNFNPDGSVKG